MDRPTCTNCHKPGVQTRISNKTGRPYLANVQTYDSGASYFRGLHTNEECAAYLAEFNARVAESMAREEQAEALRQRGLRAHMLTTRFVAIYGADAVKARWDDLYARWHVA